MLKLFHSFQRKHSVCLFYIFRCRAFKDLLKVKRYKRMILQYVCRGSKIILGLEHMKYIFSCSFKKQRKYNSSWVGCAVSHSSLEITREIKNMNCFGLSKPSNNNHDNPWITLLLKSMKLGSYCKWSHFECELGVSYAFYVRNVYLNYC